MTGLEKQLFSKLIARRLNGNLSLRDHTTRTFQVDGGAIVRRGEKMQVGSEASLEPISKKTMPEFIPDQKTGAWRMETPGRIDETGKLTGHVCELWIRCIGKDDAAALPHRGGPTGLLVPAVAT